VTPASSPNSPASPPAAGPVARFWRWSREVASSFHACSGALGFILRRGLWPHVLLVFLLLTAITASLWTAGWFLAGRFAVWLLTFLPLERWGAIPGGELAWLGTTLEWFTHLVLVLPLGLALLWLQQPILQAIGFPIFDRLTERVEAALGNREPVHRFDLARYLRMLVVVGLPNALAALFKTALCAILGLIPVIGLFFIVRGVLLNAYYSGYGVLENYFENRGWDLGQSRDVIRSRRSLATGIGLWVNLLALIPFIGSALALTLGTVGGGLALHAWERRADRLGVSPLRNRDQLL
jgi:CysZ protein